MADTPPPRFASLHNPLARQMFSLEPSGQPFVDEALMEASAAWERLLDAGLIGPGAVAAAEATEGGNAQLRNVRDDTGRERD